MKRLSIILACISISMGCARTTTAPQAHPSQTAALSASSATGTPTGPLLASVHSNSTVLYAGHRVPDVVVSAAQWDALLANTRDRQTLGYITLTAEQGRQMAATDSVGPPARAIGKHRCHYKYLVLNHPEFLLATGVDSSFGGVIIIQRC